jgi:4-amino-4-deoxy-L-arabinose transferase-like glycosyltransferase
MRNISAVDSRLPAGAGAVAWLKTPSGAVSALILTTFAARLLFATALGLGIDESYMVAAGRKLQLSYFDHPPIAWWMAWGIAHLTGSESAFVVRLPFISLFALTTWLMYRLTAALFDPEAGLWAAVVLNIAPVLGITAGTWVLPDGPLFAALLGTAFCLIPAINSAGRAAWGWWLATGACAGLALDSKYSAALTLMGALAFLATEPVSRRWLVRPQPYMAGAAALMVFLPVLIWNAEHGWASLLFQGGRAGGSLRPLGPILAIAGQAAFLLPWIWAPLVWCGLVAAYRGPSDRKRWLLVCLAAPPILVFTAAALWGNTLFHWAAPGYLMLVPLLGEAIARRRQPSPLVRIWLAGTAAFVILGVVFVASEVRSNWLSGLIAELPLGRNPNLDVVDWTSLLTELEKRGLLDRPGLVVAALKWHEAGKIDYALGGRLPVICLGPDARQYGLTANPDNYVGANVLIVAPRRSLTQIESQFAGRFDSIEPIMPVSVTDAGEPAMELDLFIGYRLHKSAAIPGVTLEVAREVERVGAKGSGSDRDDDGLETVDLGETRAHLGDQLVL